LLDNFVTIPCYQVIVRIESEVEFRRDTAIQVYDVHTAETDFVKIIQHKHSCHIHTKGIGGVWVYHDYHGGLAVLIPFPVEQEAVFAVIGKQRLALDDRCGFFHFLPPRSSQAALSGQPFST